MPTKPSAASPFAAMGETLDFMQKMWGGMGMPTPGTSALAGVPQRMPSMLAPTIDVDELDKRIADLRAVQQWLELNAGMLRTTIQTLEVQRATIATLKGISGAMLAPIVGTGETPSAARVPPEVTARLAAATAGPPDTAAKSPRTARRRKEPDTPSLAQDALSPAAWWNTLQQQFAHMAAGVDEKESEPRKPAKRSGKRKAR
ncbi:MAG TPA: PhaM family polyhydroxyalkanoate granule multifunctional regulatory protein [Burkholderiaceae bacterium]|nr:PhaM family polyhydroxyalkanoate granule multifunctional regulatory protein [Burkholderiaceae bacterium]